MTPTYKIDTNDTDRTLRSRPLPIVDHRVGKDIIVC